MANLHKTFFCNDGFSFHFRSRLIFRLKPFYYENSLELWWNSSLQGPHHGISGTVKQKMYGGTSLKRRLTGQKFLSALERCPPWRGFNWKVPKFKVRLFCPGPPLTRTPPPLYLTMGMWNGEKEIIFFEMYQFILHQRLK